MKILIIATPRSGGTSLTEAIGSQNYHQIHEPFDVKVIGKFLEYDRIHWELQKHDNIVVRTLSQEKPPSIKYNITNFHQILAKGFDKVICLDRLNTKEHEQSHINLLWKMQTNRNVKNKWNIDEIPQEFIDEYYSSNCHHDLREQKEQLKLTSDVLGVPITWYEDLYGKDRILSFVSIKKLELGWKQESSNVHDLDPFKLNEYLNPIRRYRIIEPLKRI